MLPMSTIDNILVVSGDKVFIVLHDFRGQLLHHELGKPTYTWPINDTRVKPDDCPRQCGANNMNAVAALGMIYIRFLS